jgi:hypothetical protein
MTARLHYFEEITVKTDPQPNGEFAAIDADNYEPGFPVGFGFTRFEAIADLFEKMPRAESEREENSRRAARFDHAQDYRKNWVA